MHWQYLYINSVVLLDGQAYRLVAFDRVGIPAREAEDVGEYEEILQETDLSLMDAIVSPTEFIRRRRNSNLNAYSVHASGTDNGLTVRYDLQSEHLIPTADPQYCCCWIEEEYYEVVALFAILDEEESEFFARHDKWRKEREDREYSEWKNITDNALSKLD